MEDPEEDEDGLGNGEDGSDGTDSVSEYDETTVGDATGVTDTQNDNTSAPQDARLFHPPSGKSGQRVSVERDPLLEESGDIEGAMAPDVDRIQATQDVDVELAAAWDPYTTGEPEIDENVEREDGTTAAWDLPGDLFDDFNASYFAGAAAHQQDGDEWEDDETDTASLGTESDQETRPKAETRSKYFQKKSRRGTGKVPTLKEKYPNTKTYRSRWRMVPDPSKCDRCFRLNTGVCDKSFGPRCLECARRRAPCIEQTEDTKALVPPENMNLMSRRLARLPATTEKDTKKKQREPACIRCIKRLYSCDGKSPCNRCKPSKQLLKACRPKLYTDEEIYKICTTTRQGLVGQSCIQCTNEVGAGICSGERPCWRCSRKDLSCAYIEQQGLVKRGYSPRTREPPTGDSRCSNCRARNNPRCDNGRPCQNCVAMGENGKIGKGAKACIYVVDGVVESYQYATHKIANGEVVLRDDWESRLPTANSQGAKKVPEVTFRPQLAPDIEDDEVGVDMSAWPSTEQNFLSSIREDMLQHLLNAFPAGYRRLPTPSTNLECGLHALRLSIEAQLPDLEVPSVEDLRQAL